MHVVLAVNTVVVVVVNIKYVRDLPLLFEFSGNNPNSIAIFLAAIIWIRCRYKNIDCVFFCLSLFKTITVIKY